MNNCFINQTKIIDAIKLLIYKEDIDITKKISLNDNNTLLEPLLYSYFYFNSKKDGSFPKKMLNEILYGYFIEKGKLKITHSFNKNGIAYIPQVGYFKKGETTSCEPILKEGDFEIVKEVHSTYFKLR